MTVNTKRVELEYRGLCSTCKNASGCVFPRSIEHPVMHCDEFDGHEGPKTIVTPRIVTVINDEKAEFKGLCRNCENRNGCTYPKSEAGVWHCDEYR